MKYAIKKNDGGCAHVECRVAKDERITTRPDCFLSATASLRVVPTERSGWQSVRRLLTGAPPAPLLRWEAHGAKGVLLLAPGFAGDVRAFELGAGHRLWVQSACFLAASAEVAIDTQPPDAANLSTAFPQPLWQVTGPGVVLAGAWGAVDAVAPDGRRINAEHVVAFDATLSPTVTPMPTIAPAALRKSGALIGFSGEGAVYVQTHSPASLAACTQPFQPKKNQD